MGEPGSDIKWLEAFKNGDKQAFKKVYETTYRALYVFACGILSDDHSRAEDIVQECFQKLWKNRDRMANESHVRNFLYLTARNSCINVLRHKNVLLTAHREVANLAGVEEQTAETARIHAEVIAEMYRQVELLPPKYAEVIRMFYFKEMTAVEVGQALGITSNAAMILKSRALKILRLKVMETSFHISVVLLACLYTGD